MIIKMETLIILHGAIGAKDQFRPLADKLSSRYNVVLHDFPGHGDRVDEDIDFSMDNFVEDLDKLVSQYEQPIVFGYSMGGYVAILHAARHPGKIKSIITLGSKVNWSPEIAKKESAMLNPDVIEQKIPKFAEILNKRHQGMWKEVLQKTKVMMFGLGEENKIQSTTANDLKCPLTMLLAENDEMVSKEETDALAKQLKASRANITNSNHPIEKVDLDELVKYF